MDSSSEDRKSQTVPSDADDESSLPSSNASVLLDCKACEQMILDVIDLDELQTGYRREGIFFSFMVFAQKVSLGIALFISGQVLELLYPSKDTSDNGVSLLIAQGWGLRGLTAGIPAIIILLGLACANGYAIDRSQHLLIAQQLRLKRQRSN